MFCFPLKKNIWSTDEIRITFRNDSNPMIDKWYQLAMENGAIGGKLVGAGGGGFLMFMAKDRDKLRQAMVNSGMEEVRFGFDFEGSKVVMTS